MSNNVFTVSLLLKMVNEVTAPLRQAIGSINELKGAASSVRGRELSQLTHAASQASQSFAMFGLAADGLRQSWSLLTAPLRLLNEAIVEPTAKYEMFLEQLKTTEKSAEAANKAFDWIKTFAKETPYGLDATMQAFLRLRAYGLDPMDGTLKKLGDTASKTGGSSSEVLLGVITAIGQASAKTKLQAEEMLQLTERQVPAWDLLAQAMHKPIPELMGLAKDGQLGREAIRALIDAAGRDADGAMDRTSQTFDGLEAALKDTWEQVRVGIGQGGLLDVLKDGLRSVNTTLMELSKSGELPALTQELGHDLAEAARSFIGVLPDLRDAFSGFAAAIAIVRREVKLAVSDWDQVVDALTRVWARMVPILNAVRDAENVVRGLVGAQQLAPYAMPELPTPEGGGGGPRRGGPRGSGGRGTDDLAGGIGTDRLLPAARAVVPSIFGLGGQASPAAQPASGRIVVEFRNAPTDMRVKRIEADGIDLLADLGWVML